MIIEHNSFYTLIDHKKKYAHQDLVVSGTTASKQQSKKKHRRSWYVLVVNEIDKGSLVDARA